MSVVTGAARNARCMLPRDDLREGFRFRAIRLMTDNAECGSVGKDRFLAGEIPGVTAERAVARFASDIRVRAFAFSGGDIDVALGAGFASGKNGAAGSDFIE